MISPYRDAFAGNHGSLAHSGGPLREIIKHHFQATWRVFKNLALKG